MPITPLHFGVLAPINHFFPKKVNNVSFIIGNVWMDLSSIVYALLSIGDFSHESHTLLNAYLMSLMISIFRGHDFAWVLGALLGTFSHLMLDSLVHTDIRLVPWMDGNPFYMGWMEPLSLLLAYLTGWWVWQCRSCIRAKIGMH